MDFLGTFPHDIPRNTYNCLAAITIGSSSRRGSIASNTSDDNALTRVLSRSSRRRSLAADTPHLGAHDQSPEGTWFWRVQVGVTDENLVILPLSNPPNPLLRSRPGPLSGVIPSPSNAATGLGAKLKGMFSRSREPTPEPESAAPVAATSEDANKNTDNAPHEENWPGVVEGHPLAAIIVPLHYIHADKVHQGGDDKVGCHVSVIIGSAIAGKSGHLRFEFDREWIGAKAEAELLAHNLTLGIEKAGPLFTTVKVGGSGTQTPADKPADWKEDLRGGGKW